MNSKDTNLCGKYSLTILIVLIFIIVVLSTVFSLVFRNNLVDAFDEKAIVLDSGWTVTNSKGEEVEIDFSKQLKYGIDGKYSFTITLPETDTIISSPVIFLYSDHFDLTVFLDGQEIYTYPLDQNTTFLGLGTSYHYVRLSDYQGKTLRVDIRCQLGDSVLYTLKTPLLGGKAYLINENLKGSPISFLFAAFSFIMTIVLLAFYIFYKKKLNLNINIVHFALFTLLLSIYISLESTYAHIYVQNPQIHTTLIYCVLALLPIPIFCYLTYYVSEKLRYMVAGTTIIFFSNFIIQFILHFSKTVDMRTMLPITQSMIVLTIVMVIVLTIISKNKYSIPIPRRIKVASPMMIGAIIDLILLLNNVPSLNYCLFFLIGVTFFIVFELLSFGQSYLKLYKTSIEIDTLKNMAFRDSLTSLENQNSYEKYISENNFKQSNYGCLVIDINKLKSINDTQGHNSGDIAIRICGNSISECINENIRAFRSGGDEFIVIVENANENQLFSLTRKIINRVKINSSNVSIPVGVSIGYAIFDKEIDTSITDTITRADKKMYEKKWKK